MTSVELHDLSKRFGTRWVLARLSFRAEPGEAVLLTGENGAGKTTLIKLLATLIKPTFGRLELFGEPGGAVAAQRQRIGLMTHQTHLYDMQSGRENLEFFAALQGEPNAQRVDEMLAHVGLAKHAGRPVRTFSAGMKRRLVMAQLMLKAPRLVLLDEPWTQLDPEGMVLMDELITTLRKSGATLIIATHDIERGLPLCDTRLHLAQGRRVTPPTPPASARAVGGAR